MSQPLDLLIDEAKAQVLSLAITNALTMERDLTRLVLNRMAHRLIEQGRPDAFATLCIGILFVLESQWKRMDRGEKLCDGE